MQISGEFLHRKSFHYFKPHFFQSMHPQIINSCSATNHIYAFCLQIIGPFVPFLSLFISTARLHFAQFFAPLSPPFLNCNNQICHNLSWRRELEEFLIYFILLQNTLLFLFKPQKANFTYYWTLSTLTIDTWMLWSLILLTYIRPQLRLKGYISPIFFSFAINHTNFFSFKIRELPKWTWTWTTPLNLIPLPGPILISFFPLYRLDWVTGQRKKEKVSKETRLR